MKTKLSIALGSLLGAAVIHLVLTACGNGSTPGAKADTTCSSWQTSLYYYSVPADYENIPTGQILGTTTIPAGWEPVHVEPFGGSSTSVIVQVSLRKCAAP